MRTNDRTEFVDSLTNPRIQEFTMFYTTVGGSSAIQVYPSLASAIRSAMKDKSTTGVFVGKIAFNKKTGRFSASKHVGTVFFPRGQHTIVVGKKEYKLNQDGTIREER